MKKFVCTVCGYIHEGETAPEVCPVCKVGADKFEEMKGEMVWADEHRIGVAPGVDEEIIKELKARHALVIISCHDTEDLQELSDTIFTMENGSITAMEKCNPGYDYEK